MDKNQRKNYWIDLPFQRAFILKFVLIVLGSSFLIGMIVFIFAQNSTTVAIEKTKIFAKPTSDFILPVLSLTVVLVSLAAVAVVIWVTLYVSHRIAGPIFRLKKEVELIKNGHLTADFHVRENDQLKDLAASLQAMSKALHSRHVALKMNCDALAELLQAKHYNISDSADREAVKKMIDAIQSSVNHFKT